MIVNYSSQSPDRQGVSPELAHARHHSDSASASMRMKKRYSIATAHVRVTFSCLACLNLYQMTSMNATLYMESSVRAMKNLSGIVFAPSYVPIFID